MKKDFNKGFVTGIIGTLGAVAGSIFAFRQVAVAPENKLQEKFEENHKKANRKMKSTRHN